MQQAHTDDGPTWDEAFQRAITWKEILSMPLTSTNLWNDQFPSLDNLQQWGLVDK